MKAVTEISDRLAKAVRAWETLAADRSFGGMTLPEFKAKVQESLDARQALRAATDQLMVAQNARTDTDAKTLQALSLVVNAIKGDPEHGDDSSLYEACGYVRRSEKRSGLSRKAKTAQLQQKAA